MNAQGRRRQRRMLRQHLPGLVVRIATARIVHFAPAPVIDSWALATKDPRLSFAEFERIHRAISSFEKESARYI